MAFLQALRPSARVLDVGCGNASPARAKRYRPDIHYTGVDVADHNQTSASLALADRYILLKPEDFASGIAALESGNFDAVISRHNLEHCSEPDKVLEAMSATLAPGGLLYLVFPCEASVDFPRRQGTLNFWDDPTHVRPPNWANVLSSLKQNGLNVLHSAARYRPPILATIGAVTEPASILTGRIGPYGGTWALYGFESVIWAQKPAY
ncbi:class I SAM-dependent methyltransferase [Bradyrhizobium manausense]|uniref:class I SAM-dependent methyltransferase n=1 Tax=Bradyrhizobium manausense TaxID=989370 RepID=UPI00390819B8